MGSLTWNDLTSLISEQVALLINSLHHAEEKVMNVEKSSRIREEELTHLHQLHEEQLKKLSSVAKDSSLTWQQQKAEMESHYSVLLAEIHARHKKTQALADQAWERVRATGSVQQGLEAECSDLCHQLESVQHEHKVLLTTCALSFGAFYPLYSQVTVLASQRNVLMELFTKMDSFKYQVHKLVEALEVDSNSDKLNEVRSHLPPLLRFRSAVVAVLAANRLAYQGRRNCQMMTVDDALPGLHSIHICTGGLGAPKKQFSGVSKPFASQTVDHLESHAEAWLSSKDLLNTLLATMVDVNSALDKPKDKRDLTTLLSTARSSFKKIMCHLPAMFPAVLPCVTTGFHDKTMLVHRLGNGLTRALARSKVPSSYKQSQDLVAQLQTSVLGFTKRLHSAEVERRDLRAEYNRLTQEKNAWAQNSHNVSHLMEEITSLRRQVQGSEPQEQYNSVCQELEHALKREEKAQTLLRQTEAQLAELDSRLHLQLAQEREKQHGFSEAAQGLSEARAELRRQEQLVRQLSRQVTLIEGEKTALQEHIVDAENALRTAAKDKDSLAIYMKSVGQALQKLHSRSSLGMALETMDLSPLVSVSCLPAGIGKIGPELSTCQLLVSSFLDILKTFNNWFSTLKEEITSHKQHIANLKYELNAACQREFDEELDPISGKLAQAAGSSPPTRLQQDIFSPLKEDDSYGAPTPASKPVKHLFMTPQSDRSHVSKTPPTSKRASSLNKKQKDRSASRR